MHFCWGSVSLGSKYMVESEVDDDWRALSINHLQWILTHSVSRSAEWPADASSKFPRQEWLLAQADKLTDIPSPEDSASSDQLIRKKFRSRPQASDENILRDHPLWGQSEALLLYWTSVQHLLCPVLGPLSPTGNVSQSTSCMQIWV